MLGGLSNCGGGGGGDESSLTGGALNLPDSVAGLEGCERPSLPGETGE